MNEQLHKIIASVAIKKVDYLVVACGYTSRFLKHIEEIKIIAQAFNGELLFVYDFIDSKIPSIDVPGSLYIRNNSIKDIAEFFKVVPEQTLCAYGGSICFKCSDNFVALCLCTMLFDFKHCKKFDFSTFSGEYFESAGKSIMIARFETSD